MMKPKYSHGDKVFAKVRGYPPWPARVEAVADEGSKVKYHIYFYGTGETGIVKAEDICSFVENKGRLGKPKKHKNFTEALYQIQEELTPQELETLQKLENEGDNDSSILSESISEDSQKNSIPGKAKTSLSPKLKEKKRKLNDSSSEDSELKKKSPVPVSSDNETGPQKAAEVLSRSGRKIKPKRFGDDFEDENTEDRLSSKVSPASKGTPEKENTSEIITKNYIIADFNGNKHKIPINLNKPIFQSTRDEDCWNMKVRNYALNIKKKVEAGEYAPEMIYQLMEEWTLSEANNYQNQNIYSEQSKVRTDHLRSESTLLEIDLGIRSSLRVNSPDPDKCLALLDRLKELKLTPLMLKKHPDVVTTIKKIRRYIGTRDHLTPDQEEEFDHKAEQIRDKADHIYLKFASLFLVPCDMSFWKFFEEERLRFEGVTEELHPEAMMFLTNDPS